MKHNRKHFARIKRIETMPLPPSLEVAFEQIEQLDQCHPESRGQTFAGMILPASRANGARTAQDGR